MSGIEFQPWEPEESVGKIWHAFASKLDQAPQFDDEAVTLSQMQGRLGILFRGLGGARDVEIRAAPLQDSEHRLSRVRAIGTAAERISRPSFDGEVLRLPDKICVFPNRDANTGLYVWLAAAPVFLELPESEDDPLRADIRMLQATQKMVRLVLSECPGLRELYANLCLATRHMRGSRMLPPAEMAVETAILHLLGGPPPAESRAQAVAAAVRSESEDLSGFSAPRGYKTFMPVGMWPDLRASADRLKVDRDDEVPEQGQAPDDQEERTFKASRKKADQAVRKDSLILHRFESIFSWAEFLNINRRIEDDDEDSAKKAVDDQEEISLTQVPQRARAKIRLNLDLAPEEAEFERLAGEHIYPEWDHRTKQYLPDYCRVLAGIAAPSEDTPAFLECPLTRRRIRNVRRQFEALRPKRVQLTRQVEGDDIDIEAAVAARVELLATGEHSDRVYQATRSMERDLAVSILLDTSRSTESIVAGRPVIDIAREALIALAWGLSSCGDETSIDAFSSLRRDRIFIHTCKSFDQPMSATVERQIAGLRPGHYTRLGAAVRHVSGKLAKRMQARRLLIVLTDGKPNDLDHYEGRHGIEDTHMAVREARRLGQSVFGITIDAKSQASFSRIFGRGGYVVIPNPEKLTAALPQIYAHLVSG